MHGSRWPNGPRTANSPGIWMCGTYLQRAYVAGLMSEVFKGGPFEGRPLDMIVRAPGGADGVGIRVAPGTVH